MTNIKPLYVVILLASLSGCTSHPEPAIALAERAAMKNSEHALSLLLPRWWERFEDPVLNRLMKDALRDNLDLAAAVERVREVRAQRSLTAAGRYPEIGLAANYGRSKNTLNGITENHLYGVDLAWELDLFGRLKALRNQASAELKAAEQDYLSLRLSLMAEVTNSYLQYRHAQRVVEIATEVSLSQAHIARVIQDRLAAGMANRLDLERIESQVAITQAEVPAARQQAQAASHTLAYLLASEQSRIDSFLDEIPPTTMPSLESALPQLLTMPAEVLRERPDVRAAELRLYAADESLVAAKAARYPQLTLGLLAGIEQGGASAWALSSQLFQPLFDFGRTTSRIEAVDARREQARIAYQASLLQALRETHSALQAYDQGVRRLGNLDQATSSSIRAVDLARQQHDVGTVSLLEVLDAERSLFDVQRSQAQAKVDVALRWVEINRALGNAPVHLETADEAGEAKPPTEHI
jgi:NodT family efflux transporter outer membrane factor (OMF) lipoprotein